MLVATLVVGGVGGGAGRGVVPATVYWVQARGGKGTSGGIREGFERVFGCVVGIALIETADIL